MRIAATAALCTAMALPTANAQQPYFSSRSGPPEHIEQLLLQFAIAAMQRPELSRKPVVMIRNVYDPVVDGRTWIGQAAHAGRLSGDCPLSDPAIGCTHGLYKDGTAYVLAIGWRHADEIGVDLCRTGGWWVLGLFVHELHHAAGYQHGKDMTAVDVAAMTILQSYPIVRDAVEVHDELKFRGSGCSPFEEANS